VEIANGKNEDAGNKIYGSVSSRPTPTTDDEVNLAAFISSSNKSLSFSLSSEVAVGR
jgi:hypothetical protein